ncbi:MAG: hypothetical protein H8E21_01855 [Gammaproteobacteria bacterium]|nr:hypothetical protein [Gammaproteobacteria bacterium]MBL6998844.1 hypothetical protein [Gammaproteobacteria bacterium]
MPEPRLVFSSVAVHLAAPASRFWIPDRVQHDDLENKLSIRPFSRHTSAYWYPVLSQSISLPLQAVSGYRIESGMTTSKITRLSIPTVVIPAHAGIQTARSPGHCPAIRSLDTESSPA